MQSVLRRTSIVLAVFLAPALAGGDIQLPLVFTDHMVLQRELPVPVWGTAAAGEKVTVTFDGQTKTATADKQGAWRVRLDALKVGKPRELKVAGKNTVTVKDVLVGEVWLCSGQSNMEWSFNHNVKNGKEEVAAAKWPKIRLFHVPKHPAVLPQTTVAARWEVCSPQTLGRFTAVGYFFGRHLHKELDVPIGLIGSAWGGTRIEPWVPPVGFQAVKSLKSFADQYADGGAGYRKAIAAYIPKLEAWVAQAKAALAEGKPVGPPPGAPAQMRVGAGTPTALYNGMVAPLAPFAIRGAIWYQGESNRGEGMAYHDKMKALILGWRSVFDRADMPFYFVQLAPFRYGGSPTALCDIWEAQAATLALPHTGMPVITDLVDNVGNIHPTNKQDVGLRLALWALAKTYDKKDIVYSGPLYKGMKIDGGKIRIEFVHAEGLKAKDGKALTHFAIAGEDGKFVPAEAVVDGQSVVVSSPAVKQPKHVRFGWHQEAMANLVNGAGLPAGPFKTDKWKGATDAR